MSTARKYAVNNRSMSPEARRRAYGAINISWQNMRPDLHGESKEDVRAEMLDWICGFLNLKRLESIKNLSDGQIGIILDEMKRLTGYSSPKPDNSPFGKKPNLQSVTGGAEIIHLTTDEQDFTIGKLFNLLGWSVERRDEWLRERFPTTVIRMLKFEQANSLIMILLNTAAHADLKSKGMKTGRAETSKHIKFIKKQLQIEQQRTKTK